MVLLRPRGVMGALAAVLASISLFGPRIAQAKDSTWGAILTPTQRYQVLANFNGEAVLDRETGLIWERCPDIATKVAFGNPANGESAILTCSFKPVGGRLGWRVPTVTELGSLGDPNDVPVLPHSAPFCVNSFQNTPAGPAPSFWTTTGVPGQTAMYGVSANSGRATTTASLTATLPVWCVRGGSDSGNYR